MGYVLIFYFCFTKINSKKHWKYSFRDIFIFYLLERQTEWREWESSHLLIHSSNGHNNNWGQTVSQGPPHTWQEPNSWTIICCLPQCTSWESGIWYGKHCQDIYPGTSVWHAGIPLYQISATIKRIFQGQYFCYFFERLKT